MKHWAEPSQKKLEEWAEAEREYLASAPAVGAPVMFNGARMMWFVGAELHVDGYVWAELVLPPIQIASDRFFSQ
jgi:hypothetical protein